MYIPIVLVLIASILNIGIGIAVLRGNRKLIVNQTFALFTIVVGLWIASTLFLKFSPSLFTGILTVSLGVGIGVTFFLFARVYPVSSRRPSLSFYAPFLILIIFIAFSGPSKLLIREVIIKESGSEPVFGPLYIPLVLYVSIFMAYALYKLIRTYLSSRATDRLKMTYLLIAMIGFVGTTFITNGLLPSLGVYSFVDIGPGLSAVWIFTIFIAISRQRLFGVKFVLGRLLYRILTATIPFSFFYLTFFLQTKIWGSIFATGAIISAIGIAFVYIVIFWKLDKLIRKFLEKTLIYSKYDPFETINKLLKATSTELSMEKIVVNVLTIVRQSLTSEKVGLVLFDKGNRKILYKRLIGFEENARRNMRDLLEVVNFWDFQEHSGEKSEILVLEELAAQHVPRSKEEEQRLKKIIHFMNEEKIAVLLPLNRKAQLNGLMIIGPKENEEAYTVQDIDLLESIVANASVAVGRALLHREVQDFAKTLELKVHEATADLGNKVQALEAARKREQDLLDILGHELRTPLSIIKSALGLIRFKKKKGVLTDKDIDKNVDAAEESLEREIKIVNTLLGATKLAAKKLELHMEDVDIVDVVEDGLEAQKREINKKQLFSKFERPEGEFPTVYADRTRIQEVFDNILSNGVKYTHEGGIVITLDQDRDFVFVSVVDTGVGIPKEDLNKLGTKFYRIKQYSQEGGKLRMVRPGGSGLGLYVTYGYVRAMGGEIKVKSKVEKGSTFTFSIPKFKGQKVAKDRKGEKDVFRRMGLK